MKVREEPSKSEVASRRLCIVGRDRHLSGELVASFATALGAREEFEIIEDRRRGGPPTGPPPGDRRVRQHVTRVLERDGFAIVEPSQTDSMQDDHLQLVEGRGASPIESLGLEEADEHRLERILGFNRRRRARLRRRWILTGLIGVLVALPVLSLVGRPLVSRTRPVEPPPRAERGASPLVEKNSHAGEAHARRLGLAVAETPRRTGPTLGASRSPQTGALKGSSLLVRMPQVDVTRAPAPASDGGGEAYAVRLADSDGRPLAGAEVLLLIRTADGALLDLPLGAGANPGTYSITVPPLRSALVDLRLRVLTTNTRVDIPLMP
jgi:hypothetical protein